MCSQFIPSSLSSTCHTNLALLISFVSHFHFSIFIGPSSLHSPSVRLSVRVRSQSLPYLALGLQGAPKNTFFLSPFHSGSCRISGLFAAGCTLTGVFSDQSFTFVGSSRSALRTVCICPASSPFHSGSCRFNGSFCTSNMFVHLFLPSFLSPFVSSLF